MKLHLWQMKLHLWQRSIKSSRAQLPRMRAWRRRLSQLPGIPGRFTSPDCSQHLWASICSLCLYIVLFGDPQSRIYNSCACVCVYACVCACVRTYLCLGVWILQGSVGTGVQVLAVSHSGIKLLKMVKSSAAAPDYFRVLRPYRYSTCIRGLGCHWVIHWFCRYSGCTVHIPTSW